MGGSVPLSSGCNQAYSALTLSCGTASCVSAVTLPTASVNQHARLSHCLFTFNPGSDACKLPAVERAAYIEDDEHLVLNLLPLPWPRDLSPAIEGLGNFRGGNKALRRGS